MTPARLAACLALSLAVHAVVPVIAWLDVRATPPAADVTLVDLSVDVTPGPGVTPPTAESDEPESRLPTRSGESTPAEAASEPVVAGAETRVAALEAIRQSMQGQVDSLTTENADLAARLEAEQERAATLTRQLEAARETEHARLARVEADYQDLVTALQSEIADKVIALHQANEQLTVSIVDRVLFPSGQTTLTPEGRRVMARVGTVLAHVEDRGIRVEGHTDDVPIGPDLRARFPSNWELSSARATEVVRFLASEGGISSKRLRAVGLADTEPAASNLTEAGRRQNRRIEIILLPPGQPGRATDPS